MKNEAESHRQKYSLPLIHRGSWILTGLSADAPGTEPGIIEDGALLVADGMIRAVGKYRHVAREYSQFKIRDHGNSVLAPGLVNAHCHLELSYLDPAGTTRRFRNYKGNFTTWIRDLLAEKEKQVENSGAAPGFFLNHARQALEHMYSCGVVFVGDVGNSLASRNIGTRQNTRVCFLLELLGLTRASESEALLRLADLAADRSLDLGFTAHAPYSTTPTLIRAIKKQAERQGRIFSIHTAESSQEIEFLQSGSGAFRDFLQERGAWDGSFTVPGKGAVQYLEGLGVVDHKTICVHGVHVSKAEIEILARKRAKVCLCPGSNQFLGIGKAPVTDFLAHGILPAVGTDSKASNEKLNMWREMRLLREDHPDLDPAAVFAMATKGGAEAWGVASEIGTLAAGKHACILAVRQSARLPDPSDVFEYLTTAGESVQADWLE